MAAAAVRLESLADVTPRRRLGPLECLGYERLLLLTVRPASDRLTLIGQEDRIGRARLVVLMKFSIIPRNNRFYDLFEALAQQLVLSGEVMADLLEHFENIDMKAARMKDIEHHADNITHDIYTLINKTFVTPLDREDIAALAQRMDDVVDFIEAASTAIKIYGIEAPTAAARGLADLARLQCLQLEKAMVSLREKRHLKEILDLAKEINRLENEADTLYLSAMAELFRGEMSSTDIIKWRDIYEYLEEATDSCENVAHVLESIVLKHG